MAREFNLAVSRIRSELENSSYSITTWLGVADYFSTHGYSVKRENGYYKIAKGVIV